MIKGRANQNPPYRWMTDAKYQTLGTTTTLKKALDKWWNAIYITFPEKITVSYKCADGEYDIYELADALDLTEAETLKVKITISDEWDEDSDGNPVVYAEIVEEN